MRSDTATLYQEPNSCQRMNEWHCLNCFQTGTLSRHGKCSACGSKAVIPAILIVDQGKAN